MYPINIERIENNIIELENFIKEQARLYYTDGSQVLTDAEFDALVDHLRELSPNSPILHTPRLGLYTNRCKGKT